MLSWADEQMTGFFPLSCRSLEASPVPSRGSWWAVPTGALPHHPEPPALLDTRAGTQRAQPMGWDTGRDQPSLQSLHPSYGDAQEEKLPFKFLLDVAQLIIRRKWQNKHNFPSNLEKHPSLTKLLANKPNNSIPFWLWGPHGWHDRDIYSSIYMIRKLVQDNKQIN